MQCLLFSVGGELMYHTANTVIRRERDEPMEKYIETYIFEKLGWTTMREFILLVPFTILFSCCVRHKQSVWEEPRAQSRYDKTGTYVRTQGSLLFILIRDISHIWHVTLFIYLQAEWYGMMLIIVYGDSLTCQADLHEAKWQDEFFFFLEISRNYATNERVNCKTEYWH